MTKHVEIRPPAVDGMFYPKDAKALRASVQEYLKSARVSGTCPKALIAPHAGYDYSGPIAGSAYAQIVAARDVIRRVVLLGPSHRVAFRGLAVSGAKFFETPLGNVPVDAELVQIALAQPHVKLLEAAHAQEHALEVHLPFLQQVLDAFSILPLVVGEASPSEVCQVIEATWGGPETLIAISSDLSHYKDYESAQRIDALTSRAIEALRPQDIGFEQACGRLPIQGLLIAAKSHGLNASTIDLRNSGDTAGTRDQVVGSEPMSLSEEHRKTLLDIARASIAHGLMHGKPLRVDGLALAEQLRAIRATFVTLEKGGQLRGCIGTLQARLPLAEDIALHAFEAAFEDPRFQPVTRSERDHLDMHISILSPAEPMTVADEDDLVRQLRPGKDGLILEDNAHRATFLPSVWDDLQNPHDFVAHLKRKAGLPEDAWPKTMKAYRYETESFP